MQILKTIAPKTSQRYIIRTLSKEKKINDNYITKRKKNLLKNNLNSL